MNRIRVLHLGKYYPPVPGGMERVLQLLCVRERKHVDCEVLVASTSSATTSETRDGVPITRAGSLAMLGSVGLSPALPLALRRVRADLTVIHEPNPVALVADAITRQTRPLVVYFHSEVVRPAWKYRLLYRPFLARVLERADRIIVASPAMRDSAAQLEGYRDKCVVIPYGIDTASLLATPAIQARAAAIQASARRPVILFVGRLVPYKGVAVLVRAIAGTAATLVVAGSGPMRRDLEALARHEGVADRVTFVGAVADEELCALYHACTAFVLPSLTRAEAFGLVQLEAMACGKPVISTDLPSGVPWVNAHDVSGLVVPPGDAAALGAAINRLVHDAALRERLGAGARARVEEHFTADRMARQTVALYREILNGRAA